jgi:hypothetical protein
MKYVVHAVITSVDTREVSVNKPISFNLNLTLPYAGLLKCCALDPFSKV